MNTDARGRPRRRRTVPAPARPPSARPTDQWAPNAHAGAGRRGPGRRGPTASGRWPRRGSSARFSSRSTPRNMMTNRKSTTMAPAYTMTCTAARKLACCSTKSTATPNSVMTSISAECTGLRATTTPMAPASTMAAAMAKVSASTVVAASRGPASAPRRSAWWRFSTASSLGASTAAARRRGALARGAAPHAGAACAAPCARACGWRCPASPAGRGGGRCRRGGRRTSRGAGRLPVSGVVALVALAAFGGAHAVARAPPTTAPGLRRRRPPTARWPASTPEVCRSSPSRQSSHGSRWGRPSSPTSSSFLV